MLRQADATGEVGSACCSELPCCAQVASCVPTLSRLHPSQVTCRAAAHVHCCASTRIDWHRSLCCSEDVSEPSEEGREPSEEGKEAGSASQASGSDVCEEPTHLEATDEEAEADVRPELRSYQASGGAGGRAAPPAWCSARMQHN